MALPHLRLFGSPYEQGLAQGKALSDAIAHNLEVYFRRFEVECKLPAPEARRRGEIYLGAIRRQNPDYASGMEGIAEGSGQPLIDIATLNVRYEIVYYQFSQDDAPRYIAHEAPNGCTAFAVLPAHTADGALWMGQNWDWMEGVKGAVQHTTEADGTQVLGFTEAGIFGAKIGLNSHSLGLCINGLVSKGDNWAGLGKPFHLRTYEVLRAKTLEQARAVVTEAPLTSSGNFLLGQGSYAVDLEVSPTGLGVWESDRQLVHANHYVAPERFGIEIPMLEWLDRSDHRHARLEELLAGMERPGLEQFKAALSDRDGAPYAVCRTPGQEEIDLGEPYSTVASMILSPSSGEFWVSDGPPHENAYVRYQLD
ncbi:MAG: C45 family peptidase [Meiothermus sp.]|nr:C45 family peptidase [Meiothermus sp.]